MATILTREDLAYIQNYLDLVDGGRWYPNINDLIGGWCVGTVPGSASTNRKADDIADMVPTVKIAFYIAHIGSHVADLLATVRNLMTENKALRGEIARIEQSKQEWH